MLSKLLELSWTQIMDSDYVFKSNNAKHVVQLDGDEVGISNAVVLIYYNLMTQEPMLCIIHEDGESKRVVESVNGFKATKEVLINEDGEKYTETVYIDNAMRQALS